MKIVRRFLPVLFIASAAAFILTGCTKTVDLLQYANVSITGESGDAEADIMIDYNGLGRELFGKDKNQTAFDEAAVEYSLGNDLVYKENTYDSLDSYVSQVIEKAAEKNNFTVQEFDLPW